MQSGLDGTPTVLHCGVKVLEPCQHVLDRLYGVLTILLVEGLFAYLQSKYCVDTVKSSLNCSSADSFSLLALSTSRPPPKKQFATQEIVEKSQLSRK